MTKLKNSEFKNSKKFVAMLLVLAMTISILPAVNLSVFALETEDEITEGEMAPVQVSEITGYIGII